MSISTLCKTVVGVSVLTLALSSAEDPFAGTWKMNAAKSKLGDSGIQPAGTVRIESDGGGMKVTVETTDPQGQPFKFTYQGTFDGKPGTVSGSPTTDTVSLKRVDDHTLTVTGMKDSKVVFSDRRTVSKDGKTMTISRTGTNPEGQQYQATMVFDKQ